MLPASKKSSPGPIVYGKLEITPKLERIIDLIADSRLQGLWPKEIVVNPADFADEDIPSEIWSIPVRQDPECPPGQAYLVNSTLFGAASPSPRLRAEADRVAAAIASGAPVDALNTNALVEFILAEDDWEK